jgi:predicted nucleic acid-binding protein
MARSTLVLDASVGVKWFSLRDESALRQALAIRDAHVSENLTIAVPDLFYYEVANAIVHKKPFTREMLQSAVAGLFALKLRTIALSPDLLTQALDFARQLSITVYDSSYLAVAVKLGSPLVTANPRHQKKLPDCEVIPLDRWRLNSL